MPRSARLDAPGLLHHVMIRGTEGQKVFTDNDDREMFLNRLSELLTETGTACYAWALLSGHAHFLFKSGIIAPLSTLMMRLLTGYVVSFNHRHGRRGRLFRDRYKSAVFQEDAYFKELIRYIHLNPLRSGLVSGLTQLNAYPYCGHGVLMGVVPTRFQDVDYVLKRFGRPGKYAREVYFSYVAEGLKRDHPVDLIGAGLVRSLGPRTPLQRRGSKPGRKVKTDERILGDPGFADEIFSRAEKRHEHRYDLVRQGYNLNRLIEGVGQIFSMQPEEILSKGKYRKKVLARSLFCYWAVNRLGLSLTELAARLEMSVPGVGYAVKRGASIANSNQYQLPLQRHLL